MTEPVTQRCVIGDIHSETFCPFEIQLKSRVMSIFSLKDLRIFHKHKFLFLSQQTLFLLTQGAEPRTGVSCLSCQTEDDIICQRPLKRLSKNSLLWYYAGMKLTILRVSKCSVVLVHSHCGATTPTIRLLNFLVFPDCY